MWPTPDAPDAGGAPRWERPEIAAELARHGLALQRRPEDGLLGQSMNHRIIFAAVNLHDVARWREARPPWSYASDAASSAAASMPENYDFRPTLAALTERGVPVRVVQGDDDFLPPATWTADVPGVQRVVVEGAGHLPYVDRPDRVRELVRELVLGID